MIHHTIRPLVFAAPLCIATGAPAEEISPDLMSVDDLKAAYIACERSTAGGPIPLGAIRQCSEIYETLKERAFGDDWQRLRSWSDRQLTEGTRT